MHVYSAANRVQTNGILYLSAKSPQKHLTKDRAGLCPLGDGTIDLSEDGGVGVQVPRHLRAPDRVLLAPLPSALLPE